jgi:glutathione S-transferase
MAGKSVSCSKRLAYNLKYVNIGDGDQFKPDFLKISPNNRMPAIVDDGPMGGGAPISIFESGAILENWVPPGTLGITIIDEPDVP